jgi:hypothetical protein
LNLHQLNHVFLIWTVFLDFGSSLPSASDGKVPSKCSNFLSRKQSEIHDSVGADSKDFWVSIVEVRLKDDIALARAKIHPLNLLIAFKQYKNGSSLKGKLEWDVNSRISKALEDAFYRNTKILLPFEKRCLIAISTGEDMQKLICGSSIKAG